MHVPLHKSSTYVFRLCRVHSGSVSYIPAVQGFSFFFSFHSCMWIQFPLFTPCAHVGSIMCQPSFDKVLCIIPPSHELIFLILHDAQHMSIVHCPHIWAHGFCSSYSSFNIILVSIIQDSMCVEHHLIHIPLGLASLNQLCK